MKSSLEAVVYFDKPHQAFFRYYPTIFIYCVDEI